MPLSAAPVAVMAQGFLGTMGFFSVLWSWQDEGLGPDCWSVFVPNHTARSLSCFFTIGKETLSKAQIPSQVASNTPSLWNTASLQISDLSPLPPTWDRLNCDTKVTLLMSIGLNLEILRLEREGNKEANRKPLQLSSCLTFQGSPQGLSPFSLSLLPTSLDSCFLSKEAGNIDELHFKSTLSF